ncbi:MAG: carboxyl transferase domain-containing protein [Actinomycetota bacterium]|nr:acetyl-CoA carboxylase carboxyltransferase subunit alpha/beta [Actinomycetota bacterium]
MRTDPRTTLSATECVALVLDPGWKLIEDGMTTADPLSFPGYSESQKDRESVLVATGAAGETPLEVIAFDFSVFGGSLGVVAGERIARAFERASRRRGGVIAMLASGGARMQEGMVALVQMVKTIAARQTFAKNGLPFIAYLRNPTTGGAYASFAGLADFIWAQPGATIGFAGPRVAAELSGESLPEGSHTAEFALDHGLIDEIVEPEDLRRHVEMVLDLVLGQDAPLPATPAPLSQAGRTDAWDEVLLARHPSRPTARGFAERVATGIVEIRGDRAGTTRTGLLTGLGRIGGYRLGLVAHERIALPPGAFRATQRLVRMAARFGLPLATFVDTPGANPASASESGGIVRAISGAFRDILEHPRPTIAVVTGEGGSGGALSFACCDRVLMLEHSFFSVIAPEGAAAILRRDDVPGVARDLRLTAHDLVALKIADGVIGEGQTGAHVDPGTAARGIAAAVASFIRKPGEKDPRPARLEKWRRAGNSFLRGA